MRWIMWAITVLNALVFMTGLPLSRAQAQPPAASSPPIRILQPCESLDSLRVAADLVEAAARGDLTTLQHCLTRISVNAPDRYGETALMAAAENGQPEVVKFLLANGARADVADRYGNTALIRTLLILEWGPEESLLLQTSRQEGAEAVDLREFRRQKFENPLAELTSSVPGLEGISAFLHQTLSQVRKEFGIRIAPTVSPLRHTIRALLVGGADVNASRLDGFTALMVAARISEEFEIAQWLLDRGANLNAKDALGRTALIYAVSRQNRDAVKSLLAKGADPNAADHQGITALKLAEAARQKDLVKMLKKAASKR